MSQWMYGGCVRATSVYVAPCMAARRLAASEIRDGKTWISCDPTWKGTLAAASVATSLGNGWTNTVSCNVSFAWDCCTMGTEGPTKDVSNFWMWMHGRIMEVDGCPCLASTFEARIGLKAHIPKGMQQLWAQCLLAVWADVVKFN
jgi:hypothetical protein